MFRKANNVFSTILSDVTIATTDGVTLPAAGNVVTNDNLSAGAVVMVDAGNRRTTLATLAAGDTYHIVQGRGANLPLMKSPAIVKGTESITIQKHLPAQQQITVIGYNGTTGSLPAANNTFYDVKVRKNDNDEGNRSQPFSLFGNYKTGGSATVTELAFGLARNLVKNFKDEPANGYLSIEVLSDGTAAAVGATTLAVTTGSEVATYSAAHGLSVGDFVFIKGATYQVKTVVSTTVVALSTPFVGTSETALATGTTYATEHGTLTAITATGLRLTGKEGNFDVNTFRNYFSNRFTATFSDADTLITSVQGARNGSGVWQQVAMDEYLNYGYEGQNEMIAVPSRNRDQVVKIPGYGGNTALTSKYSTINIKWKESITTLVTAHGAEGNVVIHLNLEDNAGSGILDTGTANTGETLAAALGLTPADLDE